MFLRFLNRPIRGPKWAMFERLLQLKEQSARSPYLAWYLHFYRQLPFWRKPLRLSFMVWCLLAVLAVLAPLMFRSYSQLVKVLPVLCVAGSGIQLVLAWILPKSVWPKFLLWARSNDSEVPADISLAEIVVPPFALTSMRFFWPFFGLGVAAIAGIGFQICADRTMAVPLELNAMFTWLYTLMFLCLAGPVFVPSLCLVDSAYWWAFSKRIAKVLCWFIAIGVLGASWAGYALLFSAGMSKVSDSNPSSFLSYHGPPYCLILWFVALAGVYWWLALWIAQMVLVRSESAIKERFESQLPHCGDTSSDAA